jgi:hypothetical protein
MGGWTQINYLCNYDLYGPVRNVFDAGLQGGIWWSSDPWKVLVANLDKLYM